MISIIVFLDAVNDRGEVLVQTNANCALIDLVFNSRQNRLMKVDQNSKISIELNNHSRVYSLVVLGKKYWLFTSVVSNLSH